MKKIILIIVALISLYANTAAQNQIYIDDRYTIAGSDTIVLTSIDTLSKQVSAANLSVRFSLGFQMSIYSPTDTLEMFIGTTPAFTAGMTTTILPAITFNSAYNKIRSGLNVFIRNKQGVGTGRRYYFWLGGI